MQTVAVLGAGGHASVAIDLLRTLGNYTIVGVYDDVKRGHHAGVPIIGTLDDAAASPCDAHVIAIGDDRARRRVHERLSALPWATLIHPRSIVSQSSQIGEGSVVCAGAVIQTGARIGAHCIANTSCNIDHGSIVNAFSSVGPACTVCGDVTVGELTFLGANSTIIQGIRIGDECTIGAGTVVLRNVGDSETVVGNPARVLSSAVLRRGHEREECTSERPT